MSQRTNTGTLLPVSRCAFTILALSAISAVAAPRDKLRKDVESYAVAACLTKQDSPEIKNQGDAWANAIVQRGHGAIEDWQPLIAAVEEAIKTKPMLVIKRDGPVSESSKPISIAYCSELIDDPSVNTAIMKVMKKMKPGYNDNTNRR